jgi:hypothetical protein
MLGGGGGAGKPPVWVLAGGGGGAGGRLLPELGAPGGLLGAGGGGTPGFTGAGRPRRVFWRGAEGGGTGPRLLGNGAGAEPVGRDFFAANPSNTSRSELALSLIDAALSALLLDRAQAPGSKAQHVAFRSFRAAKRRRPEVRMRDPNEPAGNFVPKDTSRIRRWREVLVEFPTTLPPFVGPIECAHVDKSKPTADEHERHRRRRLCAARLKFHPCSARASAGAGPTWSA